MSKRSVLAVLAVALLTSVAGQAAADEKAAPQRRVFTLPPITVVGNPPRPSVVIEVARAKPEIKLANLQDPAVEKIIRAAGKAPF